jgi:hypothetical protein
MHLKGAVRPLRCKPRTLITVTRGKQGLISNIWAGPIYCTITRIAIRSKLSLIKKNNCRSLYKLVSISNRLYLQLTVISRCVSCKYIPVLRSSQVVESTQSDLSLLVMVTTPLQPLLQVCQPLPGFIK